MKKLWLGLLAGLLLLTYQPSLGLAASTGTTNSQISFYSGTTTTSSEDQINSALSQGTGVQQTSTSARPATITGSLQQVLSTGRLPQTGESAKMYQRIFGVMLLLATVLSWVFYRQVRGERAQRES